MSEFHYDCVKDIEFLVEIIFLVGIRYITVELTRWSRSCIYK